MLSLLHITYEHGRSLYFSLEKVVSVLIYKKTMPKVGCPSIYFLDKIYFNSQKFKNKDGLIGTFNFNILNGILG